MERLRPVSLLKARGPNIAEYFTRVQLCKVSCFTSPVVYWFVIWLADLGLASLSCHIL